MAAGRASIRKGSGAMNRASLSITVVLLACFVAACGSESSSTPQPESASSLTSSGASTTGSGTTGSVTGSVTDTSGGTAAGTTVGSTNTSTDAVTNTGSETTGAGGAT